MSQTGQIAPEPPQSTATPERPAASVGNVPFVLVLLSAILVLIPWTRPAGLTFLVLLAIPALVVWVRARRLTDGSRGLTTSTLVIGFGAFLLGGALSPTPVTPVAAASPSVQQAALPPVAPLAVVPPAAPAPQAAMTPRQAAPARQAAPMPQQVRPVPRPLVQTPPRTAAPAPRANPVPRAATPAPAPAPLTSSGYFKNCSEARAAGAAPLRRGDAGYSGKLDRDSDGIACE